MRASRRRGLLGGSSSFSHQSSYAPLDILHALSIPDRLRVGEERILTPRSIPTNFTEHPVFALGDHKYDLGLFAFGYQRIVLEDQVFALNRRGSLILAGGDCITH